MSILKTIGIQHLNGSSPNIQLDSSGKVGIGTSSPAALLDVRGGSSDNGTINITNNSGNVWKLWNDNGSSGMNIQYNGTTRMSIDSSGRMIRPYQPAFWVEGFAWSSSIQRPSNGTVRLNVGSHYNNSNGIFTSPIAGNYLFICTVQGHNPGETAGRNGTYYNLKANVNGSDIGNEIVATAADVSGKHDQITYSLMVYLAANDTFYFNSNYGFRSVQNSYTGCLLS